MLKTKELLERLGPTSGEDVMHPMAKMQTALKYIANNMEGNETDAERLNEIVFAVKKNIAETIINIRGTLGLSSSNKNLFTVYSDAGLDDAETGNAITSMFILSPETILKNMAEGQLTDGNNESAQLTDEEKAMQEKYRAALNLLNGKEISYSAYESTRRDIMNERMFLADNLKELEGDDPIAEAVSIGKRKGFFERIFRRTSKQYKNFEKVFKARGQGAATREELDNAAKAYLMRKLPRYDGQVLIKPTDFAGLSETEKNRAVLCYKTLLANKQAREYEKDLANIEKVAEKYIDENNLYYSFQQLKQGNSNLQNNQNDQPALNNEEQVQFQKDLENDVKGKSESNNAIQKEDAVLPDNQVINENLSK